jgi:hypothetical protein
MIWLHLFGFVKLLSVFYENEPRITIDTNPTPYYCVDVGSNVVYFIIMVIKEIWRL